MLTKSGGAAGTKVRSASTTQTVAQVLQSAALSGKPATYGGKPIIIGGKPLQIGGKPLQIGGKPVQVIGKPGQIGVLQGQLTGQGSLMSALNIITQVRCSFQKKANQFNPLSPHVALKHRFIFRWTYLIFPELGVLEWNFPWNWFTWQFS